MRDSASGATATRMSQPITASASPVAMRTACRASGCCAMRTCDITAPFFCDRPVMSSTLMPLPSRWLAMPSTPPMVMTPVPPTPVTRMLYGRSQSGSTGCGRRSTLAASGERPLARRSLPPCTLTKLGQKPLRQE